MPCSPAKLAANIANARKGTGPKTPEGKERSRANALKHGSCSEVVRAPEDPDMIGCRSRLYFRTLKPQNDFHLLIIKVIAVLTLRIGRRERDRIAPRAEHFSRFRTQDLRRLLPAHHREPKAARPRAGARPWIALLRS